MNASWSMVFGALLAGTVGGFMIPVRPEIRDVPALTASKATEPAKKPAIDKTATMPAVAKAENASNARKIPLTESASGKPEPDVQPQPSSRAAANDCARETWPYRSPGCLDRTAKVAPADTVVAARRVDPSVSLQDTTVEMPAKPVTATAKPEAAKSQQKVVSTPPAREERNDRATSQPEPAAARPVEEPRAQAVTERRPTASPSRRAARRASRDPVDFNDGIPTRIYLRGPDGRLYRAPEYRPSGRTIYFVR